MVKLKSSGILSLVLLISFLLIGCQSKPEGIFISPEGNDSNPGTIEKPFLTPERARDAVREMKKSGNFPAQGITICLRGGDYFCTKTLELLEEDSGSEGAPVIWKNYKNEQVRFLGGNAVHGFQPVPDGAVLERLQQSAKENVLVADLKAQGITDFGILQSRGFGRPIKAAHGELFFGGKPMTLARWPDTGSWEYIAGFPMETGADDGHGTIMGSLNKGFFYKANRPTGWKDQSQIWLHGYWAYDWANSYEKLADLDTLRKFIRTEEPYGNYAFCKGQRFYYLNILEELDKPGEWFVDYTTGKLYFFPPAPIDSGEVLFSIMEQPLVKLTNTSNVIISGITFEATRGHAIEISGGEGNLVAGCHLCNIGNWAVIISGGNGHGVRSCDISYTGDGGVNVHGGDRQTLSRGNHFVDNCHFQHVGRWSKCYVPAISLNGVGLRASHNLIHDHPHCAILFWGNDHRIEYNDIHHIALETGDVGAIYTGRDYSMRGNRIRYNYIHETGGVGMGSMGVYMDDCVSGTEVSGNVFYKVHRAMFIGGGRDHRVENNLFVDCDPALRVDGRGLSPAPVWFNMVNEFMRKRLREVPAELYRQRYPAIKTLDDYYGKPEGEPITGSNFKGIPPEGNVIARNACFGKWKVFTWFADEKIFDIRDNYVSDDLSQIGGPETGFLLPKDSPVFKTGFTAIPFDPIGLKEDEYRKLHK